MGEVIPFEYSSYHYYWSHRIIITGRLRKPRDLSSMRISLHEWRVMAEGGK